ncbi:MAG: hypothetical protein Q7S03_03420 [bacterium]|nr:hypothetical protein [bacterium]
MSFANLNFAIHVLEFRGMPIPVPEREVREAAFRVLHDPVDFLLAHEVRLGKEWPVFNTADWEEVLKMSGKERVEGNLGAYAACRKRGLI